MRTVQALGEQHNSLRLGADGLEHGGLAEPDLMVPAGLVNELLERAASRAGEPAFGLRMAATRWLSKLGPLGLLLRDQPTLRLALEALARHIHVHNESFSVTVVETGPLVGIREEILMERGRPVRQALELGMGTLFRVLRIFLGESWRPQAVMFRHPAPASMAWHRQVFGAAVHFRQEHNEIVCRGSDLEAPNPGADPAMAQYAQRLLALAPWPLWYQRPTSGAGVGGLIPVLNGMTFGTVS